MRRKISAKISPTDHTSTSDERSLLTRLRVGLATEKNFWRPIPAGGDILSLAEIEVFELGKIGLAQPEVADFEVAVLIDQDVLRFLRIESARPTRSRCSSPAECK